MAKHGARDVVAIDISKDALRYGSRRYQEKNLHFVRADAFHLPLRDCSFEVVICFEIIEHLKDCTKFLSECKRVPKNQNLFIISTPNKLVTSHFWKKPLNPDHVKEFTPNKFKILYQNTSTSLT